MLWVLFVALSHPQLCLIEDKKNHLFQKLNCWLQSKMLGTCSCILSHYMTICQSPRSVLCHLPESTLWISAPLHTPLPNAFTSKRIVAVGMVTGSVPVNVPGCWWARTTSPFWLKSRVYVVIHFSDLCLVTRWLASYFPPQREGKNHLRSSYGIHAFKHKPWCLCSSNLLIVW